MILGFYIFLLFSVSATLKVCIYIIAHKKIMSTLCFKLNVTKLNKHTIHCLLHFQALYIWNDIHKDINKGY